MKKALTAAIMAAIAGSVGYAANPVTVDADGGADFTTIAAAIASFTSTGSNNGETPPFIINVDPTDTFDEDVKFDSTVVGVGDIVGDVVLQSATPGTLVPLALQGEDGLFIFQNEHDVTIRDFLLYPSTTGGNTDELVRLDEDGPNNTFNTVTLENVIITETDSSGVPLITSRAQAYDPPTTLDTGSRTNGFASNLQWWGDAGESQNLTLIDCVIYGLPSGSSGNALRVNQVGQDGEALTVVDTVFAYGGAAATVRAGTSNTFVGTWDISGTDQTAGPADATVVLSETTTSWTFEGTLAAGAGSSSIPVSFSNLLLSGQNGVLAFASATHWDISLSDSIISVPSGIGLETNANTAISITNVTMDSDEAVIVNAGASTITVRDSIFSGSDDAAGKFGGAATATLDLDFCGFDTTLPIIDPASSLVDSTGSNIVIADPLFLSTDISSADFYDVDSQNYGGAGSGSSDLAGGANYIGSTSVRDWMQF